MPKEVPTNQQEEHDEDVKPDISNLSAIFATPQNHEEDHEDVKPDTTTSSAANPSSSKDHEEEEEEEVDVKPDITNLNAGFATAQNQEQDVEQNMANSSATNPSTSQEDEEEQEEEVDVKPDITKLKASLSTPLEQNKAVKPTFGVFGGSSENVVPFFGKFIGATQSTQKRSSSTVSTSNAPIFGSFSQSIKERSAGKEASAANPSTSEDQEEEEEEVDVKPDITTSSAANPSTSTGHEEEEEEEVDVKPDVEKLRASLANPQIQEQTMEENKANSSAVNPSTSQNQEEEQEEVDVKPEITTLKASLATPQNPVLQEQNKIVKPTFGVFGSSSGNSVPLFGNSIGATQNTQMGTSSTVSTSTTPIFGSFSRSIQARGGDQNAGKDGFLTAQTPSFGSLSRSIQARGGDENARNEVNSSPGTSMEQSKVVKPTFGVFGGSSENVVPLFGKSIGATQSTQKETSSSTVSTSNAPIFGSFSQSVKERSAGKDGAPASSTTEVRRPFTLSPELLARLTRGPWLPQSPPSNEPSTSAATNSTREARDLYALGPKFLAELSRKEPQSPPKNQLLTSSATSSTRRPIAPSREPLPRIVRTEPRTLPSNQSSTSASGSSKKFTPHCARMSSEYSRRNRESSEIKEEPQSPESSAHNQSSTSDLASSTRPRCIRRNTPFYSRPDPESRRITEEPQFPQHPGYNQPSTSASERRRRRANAEYRGMTVWPQSPESPSRKRRREQPTSPTYSPDSSPNEYRHFVEEVSPEPRSPVRKTARKEKNADPLYYYPRHQHYEEEEEEEEDEDDDAIRQNPSTSRAQEYNISLQHTSDFYQNPIGHLANYYVHHENQTGGQPSTSRAQEYNVPSQRSSDYLQNSSRHFSNYADNRMTGQHPPTSNPAAFDLQLSADYFRQCASQVFSNVRGAATERHRPDESRSRHVDSRERNSRKRRSSRNRGEAEDEDNCRAYFQIPEFYRRQIIGEHEETIRRIQRSTGAECSVKDDNVLLIRGTKQAIKKAFDAFQEVLDEGAPGEGDEAVLQVRIRADKEGRLKRSIRGIAQESGAKFLFVRNNQIAWVVLSGEDNATEYARHLVAVEVGNLPRDAALIPVGDGQDKKNLERNTRIFLKLIRSSCGQTFESRHRPLPELKKIVCERVKELHARQAERKRIADLKASGQEEFPFTANPSQEYLNFSREVRDVKRENTDDGY